MYLMLGYLSTSISNLYVTSIPNWHLSPQEGSEFQDTEYSDDFSLLQ